MRPIIFDTDIGTDVDDILALVLLAKAPELKLLGVTTVYGDTAFRAKIAKATTHLLDREDIAIVPGERHTLSGRQVHWAGALGRTRRRRDPASGFVRSQGGAACSELYGRISD